MQKERLKTAERLKKVSEVGMSWRNDSITDKQESMIAKIEEDAVMNGAFIPSFNGTTKGEACDYIGNYIHVCHLSAFDPNEDAGDRV